MYNMALAPSRTECPSAPHKLSRAVVITDRLSHQRRLISSSQKKYI